MIALVCVTDAGRAAARRLAEAWPGRVEVVDGPAATALPEACARHDAVVAFLAVGATVRLLAPVLAASPASKADGPAVVCVDHACRYAVPVLGGHAAGANRLAREVSEVLGTQAVVTTATDSEGIPGLDDLGLPVSGDVAGVSTAILDGREVTLVLERPWPLPAFPPCVRVVDAAGAPVAPSTPVSVSTPVAPTVPVAPTAPRVVVTDRAGTPAAGEVLLRPPTLVAGVGARRDADPAALEDLLRRVLHGAGLAVESVREVVTVDAKADEPAVLALAAGLGVPLRTLPADELSVQDVPHPSETVRAAVGTPSVAEAAVLAVGASLVVPKTAGEGVTVALGRLPVRGRLAVVGIGPGARDLMTPRAVAEIRAASVLVGLASYVDQVRDLVRPGTLVLATGMGDERERVSTAVAHAVAGRAVALVGSGDAGVYAMASPALETLHLALRQGGAPVDVVGVPGVTAALAASALLGAPLGNDHAYISLSDLHTPWEVVERRLRAAAEGDLTVALYNPRSRGRTEHLTRALEILGEGRPATTPVGIVRNACRPGERVVLATLEDLDPEEVDMLTVVIVGASDSRLLDGRLVTPRGYRWMP